MIISLIIITQLYLDPALWLCLLSFNLLYPSLPPSLSFSLPIRPVEAECRPSRVSAPLKVSPCAKDHFYLVTVAKGWCHVGSLQEKSFHPALWNVFSFVNTRTFPPPPSERAFLWVFKIPPIRHISTQFLLLTTWNVNKNRWMETRLLLLFGMCCFSFHLHVNA